MPDRAFELDVFRDLHVFRDLLEEARSKPVDLPLSGALLSIHASSRRNIC